jgi:hypothetical protein
MSKQFRFDSSLVYLQRTKNHLSTQYEYNNNNKKRKITGLTKVTRTPKAADSSLVASVNAFTPNFAAQSSF